MKSGFAGDWRGVGVLGTVEIFARIMRIVIFFNVTSLTHFGPYPMKLEESSWELGEPR